MSDEEEEDGCRCTFGARCDGDGTIDCTRIPCPCWCGCVALCRGCSSCGALDDCDDEHIELGGEGGCA